MNFDTYWVNEKAATGIPDDDFAMRRVAEKAWNAALLGADTKAASQRPLDFTPEYLDLIERVCKIDPAAADYLEGEEIRGLDGFGQRGYLYLSFGWEETPQGYAYWNGISKDIGEL